MGSAETVFQFLMTPLPQRKYEYKSDSEPLPH